VYFLKEQIKFQVIFHAFAIIHKNLFFFFAEFHELYICILLNK